MNNSILAGRWRLDDKGSTTVEDASGNGNNGNFIKLVPPPGVTTWTGHEPTWAPSNNDETGACLNLNNGSAVVKRPPQLPAGKWGLEPQHITVEACFRAGQSPGSYAYLVSKGAAGSQGASYALYTQSTGTLNFHVTLSGIVTHSVYVVDPKMLWDGKWHVAAGTFDGTSVRLFLDGEEVGVAGQLERPGMIDYDLGTHKDLYIGAYGPSGFLSFSGGFVGEIAEVRIWNRALLI